MLDLSFVSSNDLNKLTLIKIVGSNINKKKLEEKEEDIIIESKVQ